jgi:hypothetical protein
MMRLFADGGFDLKDAAAAGRNETRRTFVEARLNYARKLKDRFLGGSARYLLQDQDSSGIEKLESQLAKLIDDALRFSCRLWSRVTPTRLYTWKNLDDKEFLSPNHLVTLCHAQAPLRLSAKAGDEKQTQPGKGSEGGRSITMIVQPAVVADTISDEAREKSQDDFAHVWMRARVLVAGPLVANPVEASPAKSRSQAGSSPSPSPAGQPNAGVVSAGSGSSGMVSGKTGASVVDVLPSTSYKATKDDAA